MHCILFKTPSENLRYFLINLLGLMEHWLCEKKISITIIAVSLTRFAKQNNLAPRIRGVDLFSNVQVLIYLNVAH